jgi:alditol oxidase
VAALELVTSDGDVVSAERGDADFDGMVVGLGALGAVIRVTLDVEPAYDVRQCVFEGLAWDVLLERFAEIAAAGYSVSVFTRWGDDVDQVWIKQRVEEPEPQELFGARPATVDRHPILGMDPVNATPQLGRPGRWSDRLPHFRMGFTPSVGEELQTEYHFARRHAAAAIETVRGLAEAVRPVLQVCELRTIAADRLWMSPQYERDTLAIHFTWAPEPEAVGRVLARLEDALAPLDPRPHWGKLFHARDLGGRYARSGDFLALRERLDPRGAFVNDWLTRALSLPG